MSNAANRYAKHLGFVTGAAIKDDGVTPIEIAGSVASVLTLAHSINPFDAKSIATLRSALDHMEKTNAAG